MKTVTNEKNMSFNSMQAFSRDIRADQASNKTK